MYQGNIKFYKKKYKKKSLTNVQHEFEIWLRSNVGISWFKIHSLCFSLSCDVFIEYISIQIVYFHII